MTDHVEIIVAGAGVVGLAAARALARLGREVLVLDAAEGIGTETSSRNSEVVHAGIHYPQGSLKATLCVAGRERLYGFCAVHGVPVRRLGKLIVATSEAENTLLEGVARRAAANGVGDLRWLDTAEARALEPALDCTAALLSPSTGIVDSHALMLAYQGDAEAAGALFAFRAPVARGSATGRGVAIEVGGEVGGEAPLALTCDWFVNSAGLDAVALANRIEGMPGRAVPAARLCKGSYYSLTGRAPFSRLIYPTPEHAGLGVHLTLDMGGQARFGPDTEWVDHIDYAVDIGRAQGFYAAIRRYWPALPDGALRPGYSGMRPKISGPGEPAADFRIDGPAAHGVPGLVNLFGIESPGLTASLAIADEVAAIVEGGR